MLFGRKLVGLGLAGALVALGPAPTAQADSPVDRLLDSGSPGLVDRVDELDRLGLLRPDPGRSPVPDDDKDAALASGETASTPSGSGPPAGLVTDPPEPARPDSSDEQEPSAVQEPAEAAASGMHPRAGRARSEPVVRTVTLVTGDRVRLEYGTAVGPRVRITPAPGREHVSFDVTRDGSAVSVVPSDARPLLRADRVDPRLFDVTGLVRQHYHDGASDRLPLLVESEPTNGLPPSALLTTPPAGAESGLRSLIAPRRLPSVGMAATELSKEDLTAFWGPLETVVSDPVEDTATLVGSVPDGLASLGDDALRGGPAGDESGEESVGDRVVGDRQAPAGFDVHTMDAPRPWRVLAVQPQRVRKVWLDGRVRAMAEPGRNTVRAQAEDGPDDNLRRIGAPAAWRHALTGKGVRVAVLDSGIDASHPDLAGRVARTRDFVGGGVADSMGHGTHVASVLAGSGEASDGKYRGVAPDSRLLVGRVLDERGAGAESEVIAGMEWAVRQNADVVNVSLGDEAPSDGSDPMSKAANRLGDRALIVAAAGNGGPDYRTISAPGAAERALTVAAVHDDGETADFSSRGPRRGDSLAKPDIAAPGVNVVGARARGTEAGPVVAHRYVELTGTSMAVPYVSGAAAILAQARPDWSPRQLKQGLMAAARSHHDGREQGAGELDIEQLVRRVGPSERVSGRRSGTTGRTRARGTRGPGDGQ